MTSRVRRTSFKWNAKLWYSGTEENVDGGCRSVGHALHRLRYLVNKTCKNSGSAMPLGKHSTVERGGEPVGMMPILGRSLSGVRCGVISVPLSRCCLLSRWLMTRCTVPSPPTHTMLQHQTRQNVNISPVTSYHNKHVTDQSNSSMSRWLTSCFICSLWLTSAE